MGNGADFEIIDKSGRVAMSLGGVCYRERLICHTFSVGVVDI